MRKLWSILSLGFLFHSVGPTSVAPTTKVHGAPLTVTLPTEAPVAPTTKASVTPSAGGPGAPPTGAPVALTTKAPVALTTKAPVALTTKAPVALTTKAPVAPTTKAPVAPTTEAPVTPTTKAPVAPTTEAPVTPTTKAPVTKAPLKAVTVTPGPVSQSQGAVTSAGASGPDPRSGASVQTQPALRVQTGASRTTPDPGLRAATTMNSVTHGPLAAATSSSSISDNSSSSSRSSSSSNSRSSSSSSSSMGPTKEQTSAPGPSSTSALSVLQTGSLALSTGSPAHVTTTNESKVVTFSTAGRPPGTQPALTSQTGHTHTEKTSNMAAGSEMTVQPGSATSKTITTTAPPLFTGKQNKDTILQTTAATQGHINVFQFSLNSRTEMQTERDKELADLCKRQMFKLQDGNCTVTWRERNGKVTFDWVDINGRVKSSVVAQDYEEIPKKSQSNKTLVAILSSCGALLLIILILAACASHHRRSYHHNQQHLTEELHTVENGYHDNPTLEVMEAPADMQEKKFHAEFANDSWIVPLDNLLKEEGLDEEDTHL